MGFKDIWGWFAKSKVEREFDDYEALSKAIDRSPIIDDPTLVQDLVAHREFEDGTIEKIENAQTTQKQSAWQNGNGHEAKRAEKEQRRAERLAELEARRAERAEWKARREEYLDERREAGFDDDDDSDFSG